ncbi:MAG: HAMP domain-containing histidine kinase [Bacteroidales bacterium]|nr:HAMP domain-containing histidine kinase [Bacteroidales bacterium]
MNKKWIFILILLICISLTGIISVQYYWIRNAIKVKEVQFDYNVKNALKNVVKKLETNETAFYIKQYYSSFSHNKVQKITTKDKKNDIFNKIIIDTSKNNIRININFNTDNGSRIFSNINIDTSVYSNNLKARFWYYSSVDTTPNKINRKEQWYEQKSTAINNIISQMMFEFDNFGNPLERRLKLSSLDKVIYSELLNEGINTNFEYAVLSGNNIKTIPVSSNGFNLKSSNNIYKVKIFPNDIFTVSDYLLVQFPHKRTHILGSILLLLIGSLIFTIIILLTFGITIYIILKQKKVSEIKSDFINNMTHEFKTPIATISLAADSINNENIIQNKEKIQHLTGIIKKENKRMNTQVESVLQMALIDKQDFRFNLQNLDIHELIKKAVENISLQIEKREGLISVNLEATNHHMLIDETHFMNIVFNLLDNANKYSDKKPEITINTVSNENGIYISVTDKGIGMTKDNQRKIFDKFYRINSGNIHDVKGFGLGLCYIKAVLLALHGNISVKSELNKGSTFEVFLPFQK